MGLIRILIALAAVSLVGPAQAYNYIRGASGGTVSPTWATNQLEQMPYTCLNTVWVNPSASASGPTGGGSVSPAQGGTGTGSQAHPYLHLSDMYAGAGDTALSAGTCINVLNTAVLEDQFDVRLMASGSRQGNANTPTGYIVLRSTDNTGTLVPAAGIGVTPATVNASAAHIKTTSPTEALISLKGADNDFWIIDGLNLEMAGAAATQNPSDCVTVGDPPLVFNGTAGPSHFQLRNSYLHGCGGAGVNSFGADWLAIQNNVCLNTSGAPGFQKSCFAIVVSQAGCPTYSLNCPPIVTGYDASICTVLAGQCRSYHQVIAGNWVQGSYEFGQPPNRTDGNCIIMDTNVIRASDGPGLTNSGPYAFRALIANNIAFSCGGRGIHAFFSQHVDMVNNTSYATHWDPGSNDSTRYNIDCFFVQDCHAYNNVSYMIGGDTTVRVDYSAGGVGPVQVNNVKGFLLTNGGVTPNALNPMSVVMQDSSTNAVVGVTIDAVNVSTTPGGLSGTLTFSGVVSTLNGTTGSAIYLSNPFASTSSPMVRSFAVIEAGSSVSNACTPWAQVTLPCTGPALQAVQLNNTQDTWQNSVLYTINSSLYGGSAFISPGPPTIGPDVVGAPGYNQQATDPLFTSTAFAISPAYILGATPVKTANGTGYTAGCKVTLTGGSATSSPVLQVDTVGGGGAVSTFHVYDYGAFTTNALANLTQSSATCGGTGFAVQTNGFYQPFWVTGSLPDFTLQVGSPAKNAGNTIWCIPTDFAGNKRSCPGSVGAYE